MEPVLTRHGYRLVAKEPKYLDQLVQRYAVNPTYYYLFALAEETAGDTSSGRCRHPLFRLSGEIR